MTIELKPLDKYYLEWARQLHNDPEVLSMLTDPTIVGKDQQIIWFDKLQRSNTSKRVVAFDGEEPVGLVRIDSIDYDNSSVCIGLDICKKFRGKGYAKKVYKEVLKEWFEIQGMNRVWLMVASYNMVAKHLYTSLGFKKEGVQREALYKNNTFFDYEMMSILRSEYNDPTFPC